MGGRSNLEPPPSPAAPRWEFAAVVGGAVGDTKGEDCPLSHAAVTSARAHLRGGASGEKSRPLPLVS